MYKIVIWQYSEPIDFYVNDSLDEVLKWYNMHYRSMYESGNCCFFVNKGNYEITFEELNEKGFF